MLRKKLLVALHCLTCLLLLPSITLAADTPDAVTTSTTELGDDGLPKPPPPKKKLEPIKKTEYDKLSYAEVLAKANNNDLVAQFELGSRFNYGRNMPKDTNKALHWLRKAANGGQKDAQRLLAVKLYDGFDVTPNFVEAMKWAEKLAEQHDVAAAVMMGNMYANGDTKGGKRNLPRAYSWYSIAATGEKSDENPNASDVQSKADELIPSAMDERDKIAGLISAKEEAEAQRFASNWWIKHPPPVKAKETIKDAKETPKEAVKQPAAAR